MASAEEEEDVGAAFLCSFFSLSSVLPLVRLLSWDRPGRRANGGNGQCVHRHGLHRSHAINDKTIKIIVGVCDPALALRSTTALVATLPFVSAAGGWDNADQRWHGPGTYSARKVEWIPLGVGHVRV